MPKKLMGNVPPAMPKIVRWPSGADARRRAGQQRSYTFDGAVFAAMFEDAASADGPFPEWTLGPGAQWVGSRGWRPRTNRGEATMTLRERCNEILHLIDDTIGHCGEKLEPASRQHLRRIPAVVEDPGSKLPPTAWER